MGATGAAGGGRGGSGGWRGPGRGGAIAIVRRGARWAIAKDPDEGRRVPQSGKYNEREADGSAPLFAMRQSCSRIIYMHSTENNTPASMLDQLAHPEDDKVRVSELRTAIVLIDR